MMNFLEKWTNRYRTFRIYVISIKRDALKEVTCITLNMNSEELLTIGIWLTIYILSIIGLLLLGQTAHLNI